MGCPCPNCVHDRGESPCSALEDENARLRDALKVFANDESWFAGYEWDHKYIDEPAEFARKTLEGNP